jgi:flagellar biosynthesis protein FlhB
LKNNIECFVNDTLTDEIYNACELFEIIPKKFYEKVAKLFAKVIKKEK